MTRPILNVPIGFAPSVVDKVERLLEVLSVLREDPFLRGAFVLHGGTALNVFYECRLFGCRGRIAWRGGGF